MSADLTTTKSAASPTGEISQESGAFDQFMERNHKYLIYLATAVAIGAAGWVGYESVRKSNEKSGGEALSKATDAASLQAVIKEYDKTPAAGSALVLLANRQWDEGKQDESVATLRKFIAENPEHPALPTAQASLGSKLLTQGKTADATQVFEALEKNVSGKYLAPYALISLGDIAKAAGDLEKAEASYKRVQTDFTDSSFAQTASRRLILLKAKPPVEIEAPPAPAPSSAAPDMENSTPPSMLTPFSPTPELPVETPAYPGQNNAPSTPGN